MNLAGTYINKQVDVFNRYLERVPANANMEDVHKLRVAIRKLRTLLSVLDHAQITTGRKEDFTLLVGSLFSLAGRLRDAQVNQLLLSHRKAGYLLPYVNYLKGVQKRTIRHLVKEIAAFEPSRVERLLNECLLQAQALTDEQLLAAVWKYIGYKLEKISRLVQAGTNDQQLHKIRVQFKPVNDSLNFLKADGLPVKPGIPFGEISKMTEQLGNWHDALVLLKSLKAYSRRNASRQGNRYLEKLIVRHRAACDHRYDEIVKGLQGF